MDRDPTSWNLSASGDEIAYYLLDLYCVEDSVYGISVNHNRLSTEYSEFLFGIKQLVE